MKLEDRGNNRWLINGETIYAPNEATAVFRYKLKEEARKGK